MSRFSLFVERERGVGAGIDFTDPAGPLAPYYLRFGPVIGALFVCALFAFLNLVRLNHTDVWAHARFGEHILQTKQFIDRDPFCPFSAPSANTLNYAWLSQTLFALVYRAGASLAGGDEFSRLIGGADALRFFHAALMTIGFVFLFTAFRRASASNVLAALGTAFIIVAASGSLAIQRPQVIAEVLFAALVMVLAQRELPRRAILIVPIVMIVWANAHGSYPMGFLTLGVVWVARLLGYLVGPPPRLFLASIDPSLRRLSIAIALAILGVTVVNPMGYRIYLATWEMAQQPNVRAMDEWQPLWAKGTFIVGARIAYGLCVSLLLLTVVLAKGRCSPQFWLGVLVFAVPPVLTQRAVVWLMFAAPWLAVTEIGATVKRWQPTWWDSTPSFRKTLLVGVMVAAAIMWSIPVQRLLNAKNVEPSKSLTSATPWQEAFAVENTNIIPDAPLAKAIAATYPGGRFIGTIFAQEVLGDFFMWRLTPQTPVFMYSHVHLFSPDRWQQYTQIRSALGDWKKRLDLCRVNLVVFDVRVPLCEQLAKDPDWLVIRTDDERFTPSKQRSLFVALRKKPLEPLPAQRVQ